MKQLPWYHQLLGYFLSLPDLTISPIPNNLAIRSKYRFWVVSRGVKLLSVLSWHQTFPKAASSGASNRVPENL